LFETVFLVGSDREFEIGPETHRRAGPAGRKAFVGDDGRQTLLQSADYVKVDLTLTERSQLPDLVRALRVHPVRLLAEKVETMAEFEACEELGFRAVPPRLLPGADHALGSPAGSRPEWPASGIPGPLERALDTSAQGSLQA
jgi:hypothetical protein